MTNALLLPAIALAAAPQLALIHDSANPAHEPARAAARAADHAGAPVIFLDTRTGYNAAWARYWGLTQFPAWIIFRPGFDDTPPIHYHATPPADGPSRACPVPGG